MWRCPKCHTAISDSFDRCWLCGTSSDGTEDPNFVSERAEEWGQVGSGSRSSTEDWGDWATLGHVTRLGMSLILGVAFSLLGLILRLSARALAWPSSYSYSGPREATVWAFRERAYEDIAWAILAFGLGLLLIAAHHWLAGRGNPGEGRIDGEPHGENDSLRSSR